MRVVVADTSPLNYLVLIDAVEVLPQLYGHILVPIEVVRELSSAEGPPEVARWIGGGPSWLEVQTIVLNKDPSLAALDPGERAAIQLALTKNETLLIIDDAVGRQEATARGIQTVGTLGVLRLAAQKNLVDLPTVLAALLSTNFRVPMSLVEGLIAEDRERRSVRSLPISPA